MENETREASKRFKKIKKVIKEQRDENELDQEEKNKGVIYVGHLPYGFFEKELRGFFSQFGVITGVKVCRSSKTARSKGFAFIEFEDKQVAEVAADAMHGYLMFGKQLVVRALEDEEIRKKTMRNANRKWEFLNPVRSHIEWYNRKMTKEEKYYKVKMLLEREAEKREKLKKAGIAYEFPGYVGLRPNQSALVD